MFIYFVIKEIFFITVTVIVKKIFIMIVNIVVIIKEINLLYLVKKKAKFMSIKFTLL